MSREGYKGTERAKAIMAKMQIGQSGFPPHSSYRPIHQAAIGDDAGTIFVILSIDPAALNLREDSGRTPLHLAAAHGCVSVVKLLTEKGAWLEARGMGGETPLHVAAQEGSDEVVVLLVNEGAEIDARDNEGRTPLKRAVDWGQGATVGLLRELGGME